ncbi:MAG: hypothetical protein GY830_05400, partial [Bacteroidetes bacterium]|nr:hypothetical protein [Bacteroidota bacterium]
MVEDASQLDSANGQADFGKSEEVKDADGAGDEVYDLMVADGSSVLVNVIQVSAKTKAGAEKKDEVTGPADRRPSAADKSEFELESGRESEAEDGSFGAEFDSQDGYSVVKIVGYAVAGIVLMVFAAGSVVLIYLAICHKPVLVPISLSSLSSSSISGPRSVSGYAPSTEVDPESSRSSSDDTSYQPDMLGFINEMGRPRQESGIGEDQEDAEVEQDEVEMLPMEERPVSVPLPPPPPPFQLETSRASEGNEAPEGGAAGSRFFGTSDFLMKLQEKIKEKKVQERQQQFVERLDEAQDSEENVATEGAKVDEAEETEQGTIKNVQGTEEIIVEEAEGEFGKAAQVEEADKGAKETG